jgi:DNA-binding IclR family transcriptional regulator
MNKTVGRLIEILEYISKTPQGATIADMSRDLGISKTSVFDIVHAAASKNMLSATDSKQAKFRLGSKAIEIFGAYTNSLGYWPIIHEALAVLSHEIDRSVYFFHCDNHDLILIDAIQSGVSFSPQISIGSHLNCISSKVGHIYLAALDSKVRSSLLSRDNLPESVRNEIDQDIELVRNHGYLLTNIDVSGSLATCISVPVFDIGSQCEGIIAVYDLANRLSPKISRQFVKKMTSTALTISHSLGFNRKELIEGFPPDT